MEAGGGPGMAGRSLLRGLVPRGRWLAPFMAVPALNAVLLWVVESGGLEGGALDHMREALIFANLAPLVLVMVAYVTTGIQALVAADGVAAWALIASMSAAIWWTVVRLAGRVWERFLRSGQWAGAC